MHKFTAAITNVERKIYGLFQLSFEPPMSLVITRWIKHIPGEEEPACARQLAHVRSADNYTLWKKVRAW